MNKQKKFLLLLAIALGIFAVAFFINKNFSVPENANQVTPEKQISTMSVDISGKKQAYDISGFIGKTALEATLEMTDVEASGTGENAFVTSIGGKRADSKKKEFWELVINGAPAQVGAGSYIIEAGDSLEWRITTY